MSTYSNWREDLIEVIDTPTTEAKALKKVKESKVKNKVVINPKLDEAVKELGGELLEVKEVDDKSGTGEDPQIKSKEKRQAMIKRQVLLKKLQAVRAGGGADITAGYEPEGEMVEGKGYQPEIEVIKSKDLKKKERESKLPPHLQGDAIGKMKKAFASEGVMKMVKKVIRSQKPEKKAQKATDAGARARRKLQQKDHEKVNFLPMEEEKDAYKYVVSKLKKQYGDGVLTKGDKIKPLTAAQKKKNAKIMAQRAKQDGRDATEKASDGRYNDRSRSD